MDNELIYRVNVHFGGRSIYQPTFRIESEYLKCLEIFKTIRADWRAGSRSCPTRNELRSIVLSIRSPTIRKPYIHYTKRLTSSIPAKDLERFDDLLSDMFSSFETDASYAIRIVQTANNIQKRRDKRAAQQTSRIT